MYSKLSNWIQRLYLGAFTASCFTLACGVLVAQDPVGPPVDQPVVAPDSSEQRESTDAANAANAEIILGMDEGDEEKIHRTFVLGMALIQRPANDHPEIKTGEAPTDTAARHSEKGPRLRVNLSDLPYVDEVYPKSPSWDAGLRKGDRLLSFDDVRDVPYETFIEGIREVTDEKVEGDQIAVTYVRGSDKNATWIAAQGRTAEERRELEQRAEALAEQRRREQSDSMKPGEWTTAELEEYAELHERRSSGGSMSEDQNNRLTEFESYYLGDGRYGGYYPPVVGPGAVAGAPRSANDASTQSENQRADASSDEQPGVAAGTFQGDEGRAPGTFDDDFHPARPRDPEPTDGFADEVADAPGDRARPASPRNPRPTNGLADEYARLQTLRQQGSLNPQQQRRIAAIESLRSSGAFTNMPEAARLSRGVYDGYQNELNRLNAMQRQGNTLTPAQTQRMRQLQQSVDQYQRVERLRSTNPLQGQTPATPPQQPTQQSTTGAAAGATGPAGAANAGAE